MPTSKSRPRLPSDNGPSYIAEELAAYLGKNRVVLENYFLPGDLEHQRYHESLDNITCAPAYSATVATALNCQLPDPTSNLRYLSSAPANLMF